MTLKAQSILVGGLVAAVIGIIISVASEVSGVSDPTGSSGVLGVIFSLFGCLAMLTSGLVAVWHYASENELTLKGSEGASIGALSGIVYAGAAMALGWILIALDILPSPQETLELLRSTGAFDQPGTEQAESFTSMMLTWGGPVISLVGGVILGLIGGVIGAAVFKHSPAQESVNNSRCRI